MWKEDIWKELWKLLFNIQLLYFMKKEEMDAFFKNLKKVYKSNIYKDFFIYFSKTWMGDRYPKSLWIYNDIINDENENNLNNLNNFHFSNNLCENINRFLNISQKWYKLKFYF